MIIKYWLQFLKSTIVYSEYKDRNVGPIYPKFSHFCGTNVAIYLLQKALRIKWHSAYKDSFLLSLYPEYTVHCTHWFAVNTVVLCTLFNVVSVLVYMFDRSWWSPVLKAVYVFNATAARSLCKSNTKEAKSCSSVTLDKNPHHVRCVSVDVIIFVFATAVGKQRSGRWRISSSKTHHMFNV